MPKFHPAYDFDDSCTGPHALLARLDRFLARALKIDRLKSLFST